MSTKKQNSSLCKLYSVYEEIREEFLDKTNVDSQFYHNILDFSQSHHRINWVSKGSNKNAFAFKVFHFCDSKLQQRIILEEEVSISKKEIELLLDSLCEFLKAFEQANKVSQIPLPALKFEIGLTKSKNDFSRHCYTDIVEHLNRQIRLVFRFEKKRLASFPSKSLNDAVINSFLQKLSTWVTAKTNICTRIEFLLPTGVTLLRAIMTFEENIKDIIGDVFCTKKKCRGEKCVYWTSFEESKKSTYECKQCKSCRHVLSIPFKDRKPCVTLFGWTCCFRKKTKLDYRKKKLSPLMRQYIPQSKLSMTKAEEANIEPVPKRQR